MPGATAWKAGRVLGTVATSFAGIMACCLFLFDQVLPLNAGVIVFWTVTVVGIVGAPGRPLALLPRLFIVLYSLPFVTTIGHLFNSEYTWWQTPLARAYISDPLVSRYMITIGLVGLLGLLTGMNLAQVWRPERGESRRVREIPETQRALPGVAFLGALCVVLALAWLSAPRMSLAEADYGGGGTEAATVTLNFNAGFLVAYIVLVALFIDCERERMKRGGARIWKMLSLLAVVAVVVVFFQFLRGDRESVALVAALILLYVTGPNATRANLLARVEWKRLLRVAAPALGVIVAAVWLGAARYGLREMEKSGAKQLERLREGLESSTWTAVLLTNLSVAAEYRRGETAYLGGRTYVDYLVSLPPGILTAALGLERPLEAKRGPGWWTQDVASGGTHVVIVPFKNFGIFGVFLFLTAFGSWILKWENGNDPRGLFQRLIYGAVATSSFFWFWYGDLNIIRGLMIALLVWVAYRFGIGLHRLVTGASGRSPQPSAA